jgi:hypothetical protein
MSLGEQSPQLLNSYSGDPHVYTLITEQRIPKHTIQYAPTKTQIRFKLVIAVAPKLRHLVSIIYIFQLLLPLLAKCHQSNNVGAKPLHSGTPTPF